MTNVIPDGGSYAAQGKLQALDPGALMLILAPEASPPIPMTIAPGTDLTDVSVGDVADVHYKCSVTFVVGSPNVGVNKVAATSSSGRLRKPPVASGTTRP